MRHPLLTASMASFFCSGKTCARPCHLRPVGGEKNARLVNYDGKRHSCWMCGAGDMERAGGIPGGRSP